MSLETDNLVQDKMLCINALMHSLGTFYTDEVEVKELNKILSIKVTDPSFEEMTYEQRLDQYNEVVGELPLYLWYDSVQITLTSPKERADLLDLSLPSLPSLFDQAIKILPERSNN